MGPTCQPLPSLYLFRPTPASSLPNLSLSYLTHPPAEEQGSTDISLGSVEAELRLSICVGRCPPASAIKTEIQPHRGCRPPASATKAEIHSRRCHRPPAPAILPRRPSRRSRGGGDLGWRQWSNAYAAIGSWTPFRCPRAPADEGSWAELRRRAALSLPLSRSRSSAAAAKPGWLGWRAGPISRRWVAFLATSA